MREIDQHHGKQKEETDAADLSGPFLQMKGLKPADDERAVRHRFLQAAPADPNMGSS